MNSNLSRTIKKVKKQKGLTYQTMVNNCNGKIDKDYLTKLANQSSEEETHITFYTLKIIAQSLDMSLDSFLIEMGEIQQELPFDSTLCEEIILSLSDSIEKKNYKLSNKLKNLNQEEATQIVNKLIIYLKDIIKY